MDAATARLLLTPEATALLERLPAYDTIEPLSFGSRLRREGADGELVSAVLSQAELRLAARRKLGDFAQSMLFTREGLEQATRLTVAPNVSHVKSALSIRASKTAPGIPIPFD